MLGMSFDQLHRCDMSPLATGLGKNKLLQSNAAELPSLGTLEAGVPRHCRAECCHPEAVVGRGCSQVPSQQRSGVPENSALPASVPLLLGKSGESLCSARVPTWAPARASQREAAVPASPLCEKWSLKRPRHPGTEPLERIRHFKPG